jgi:hypothetical protein
VGFNVLAAAIMKMTVFWDTEPSSSYKQTDVSYMNTATIIRAMITLIMEAVRTAETAIYSHETLRHNIPKVRYL